MLFRCTSIMDVTVDTSVKPYGSNEWTRHFIIEIALSIFLGWKSEATIQRKKQYQQVKNRIRQVYIQYRKSKNGGIGCGGTDDRCVGYGEICEGIWALYD